MPEQGKVSLQLLIEAQDKASKVINSLNEQLGNLGVETEKVSEKTAKIGEKGAESVEEYGFVTLRASKEVEKLSKKTGEYSEVVREASKEVEKLAETTQESVDLSEEFADTATDRFELFDEVVRDTGASLDELSGILANIGFQAISIGAALVSPFVLGVLASSKFADAMRKVSVSTAGAEDSMDELTDTAKRLGTTTKFSVLEAAEALAVLGNEGLDASEVLIAIGPALDLAAAKTLKVADAAALTAEVMRALDAPIEDTAEVLDVLVNTATNSTQSIKQLAETIGGSAAGAVRAGTEIEELAALVAVLAEAGIEGERATRALNKIMVTLAAPTAETRDALDELGVNIHVAADGSIDLVETFKELSDASITVAEANAIFGTRSAHAVIALAAQTDATDKLIASNRESLGLTKQMADAMRGGITQAIEKLKDAFNRLQLLLGDGLLPVVVKIIRVFTSLINAVADLADEFPVLFGVITSTMLALGTLLIAFGGVSIAASGFLKILAIIKSSAIASVFTALTAAVTSTGVEVAKTAGNMNFLVLALKNLRLSLALNMGIFGTFSGILVTVKELLLGVAARLRGLFAASALNPLVAFVALLGIAVVALFEWDKRLDAAIKKNRELGTTLGALNAKVGKQITSLKGMKKGSEEYNSAAKSLETRLITIAEENENLAAAAYKAADAIDDETGAIKEGSTAIEDFAQAAREVELDTLETQVELLGERFKRLKGEGGLLSETLQGIKIVSRGFWASITGGDPAEVLREIAKEAEAVKINMERSAIATLAQFKAYNEVDMDASTAEMEVFFSQIRGYSEETAVVFLEAFEKMQAAAADTTRTVKELENFSSAELTIEIDKTISKVQTLAEEYRLAAEASKLAAAGKDENAAAKLQERIAAQKKLAAIEKALNDQVESQRKKAEEELKQGYEDELADLERRKKLEIDKEWEFNLKKAKLDEDYATSRVNNLKSILEQVEGANARELTVQTTFNKDLIGLIRQRTRESRLNADAQRLHANQVRDAILDIEKQTAGIKLDLLPTTKDTFAAKAAQEIADLKRNAAKIGIADTKAVAIHELAIKKKYAREAAVFEEDVRQGLADDSLALTQQLADRQAEVLKEGFEKGIIDPTTYADQATRAQVYAIDQEIEEVEKRLEFAQTELNDNPLVVKLQIKVASLEAEKTAVQEAQEQLQREAEYAAKKKALDADATVIETKLSATGGGLDSLDEQNQLELDALANKQAARLALMEMSNATEKQMNAQKLADQAEYEQLSFDLYRANWEAKLEFSSAMAGSLSDSFGKIYELSGKKAKEFFYAEKALAMAQAVINTAVAVSKAWAQGGMYGYIGAAVAATAGAVQMATIAGETFAEGGQVQGSSPTKKSDNIPAWLTAREFVQPVDSVDYYGENIMEAMRRRLIPKEVFSGYRVPVPQHFAGRRFAEGGMASGGQSSGGGKSAPKQEAPKFDIVNVIDQNAFSGYLASTSGKNVIFNIMRSNAYELKNAMSQEM